MSKLKCSGTKIGYKDRAHAMTTIAEIRRKGAKARRPYKCKTCATWHITSKKKRVRKLKEEKK